MLSNDKKIAIRLEKIRAALSLGKGEMAEKLGIYPQDYSKFFPPTSEGESKRKPETLVVDLLSFGVNAHWYLTGTGKMFVHEIHEASEKDLENDDILRQEARKIQLLLDRGLVKIREPQLLAIPKEHFIEEEHGNIEVPHYQHRVAAGLPADSTGPAETIALPKMLVKHPGETYAVTASGDSMIGAGIEEGDILIVDTATEPQHKNIVIASINGEQTVKRLWIEGKNIKLVPGNSHYEPIDVTRHMKFNIQGVVVWVIRKTV